MREPAYKCEFVSTNGSDRHERLRQVSFKDHSGAAWRLAARVNSSEQGADGTHNAQYKTQCKT